MDTSFIDSFDGFLYIPTSSVSRIRAKTGKDHITVSLSCVNDISGEIDSFYSTTLYAFNSIVELSDVGSLVEDYFRSCNKFAGIITVTFDNISEDIHFLYCEYTFANEFHPEKSFFIASHAQRIRPDSRITIAAANHGSEVPFTIKAVGRRISDGAIDSVEFPLKSKFSEDGVTTIYTAQVIRIALDEITPEGARLSDIMLFSIEYCGIQKMCYIVPAPAYLTFSFRNIFNVSEEIDIAGSLTTKTEVSAQSAFASGFLRQYDRAVTRSFIMITEPVPSDEIPLFEQFITSHSIKMWIDGEDFDIIITEHTCEHSSDDDSLTTFRFTWQFADRRPVIFESLVNGIIPPRRNIFNDKFSSEYE